MKDVLALLLQLATAAPPSQEAVLSDDIRRALTSQGASVSRIEIRRRDGDHMTGFADVRAADGTEGRLVCTATRNPARGADYYDWRCNPTIGQRELDQMEGVIRDTIAAQGNRVRQIALSRVDDMRMAGAAIVADAAGREVRARCTATRRSEASNNFDWRCDPESRRAPRPRAARPR